MVIQPQYPDHFLEEEDGHGYNGGHALLDRCFRILKSVRPGDVTDEALVNLSVRKTQLPERVENEKGIIGQINFCNNNYGEIPLARQVKRTRTPPPRSDPPKNFSLDRAWENAYI